MPQLAPSPSPSSWASRSALALRVAAPCSAAEYREAAGAASSRGHHNDAADLLGRAAALRPQDEGLALAWALQLEAAGRAAECLQVALRLDRAQSPAAAHLLARLAAARGEDAAALHRWTAHLRRFPADVHARLSRARALRRVGDWDRAEAELKVVTRQDRFCSEALEEQVALHLERGQVAQATRPLRRLRRLVKDGPQAVPALAQVQLAMGAPTAAARALEHAPGCSPLTAAEVAAARGEHAEARRLLAPLPPSAGRALLQGQIALHEDAVDLGRTVVAEALAGPSSAGERARLLHLLGELEDRADRPAAAAAAWRAANHSWGAPGSSRVAREHMQDIMQCMDRDTMSWMPRRRAGGAGVLVVVGAPGSGVRLCASILGGDPALRLRVPAVRLPELPHQLRSRSGRSWLESLHRMQSHELDHLAHRYLGQQHHDGVLVDGDVDALPYIGLLHLLLPEARIVLMERDPQDQLLSLWRRPHPQPERSWARSPVAAKRWLRTHRALGAHWAAQLPDQVHRVRYEALLRDPEAALAPVRSSLGRGPATLPAAECVRPQRAQGPTLRTDHIGRGAAYVDWLGPA